MTDSRKLVLTWPLWVPTPAQRDAWEHSKPIDIITHLVGHEGKGSLRSYLLSKGWVNSVQASTGNDFSDCLQMDVGVDLTVLGFQHRYEVAKAVFAYLAMLKEQGIPRYIYDEVVQVCTVDQYTLDFDLDLCFACFSFVLLMN
jgi:insulysin